MELSLPTVIIVDLLLTLFKGLQCQMTRLYGTYSHYQSPIAAASLGRSLKWVVEIAFFALGYYDHWIGFPQRCLLHSQQRTTVNDQCDFPTTFL